MLTSQQAKKMARIARGDKFNCTIKNGVAKCVYNQKEYIGRGKNTRDALEVVFKKIYGNN